MNKSFFSEKILRCTFMALQCICTYWGFKVTALLRPLLTDSSSWIMWTRLSRTGAKFLQKEKRTHDKTPGVFENTTTHCILNHPSPKTRLRGEHNSKSSPRASSCTRSKIKACQHSNTNTQPKKYVLDHKLRYLTCTSIFYTGVHSKVNIKTNSHLNFLPTPPGPLSRSLTHFDLMLLKFFPRERWRIERFLASHTSRVLMSESRPGQKTIKKKRKKLSAAYGHINNTDN